ncbi:MAG TPA: hypothetical protein VFE45_15685 [Coriobacteriia bacterium]|nr:hypothetical protein [Coriobacteriia bacterium]
MADATVAGAKSARSMPAELTTSSSGSRTPPSAYFDRVGVFIQNTSGALPLVAVVCSLVQYSAHGTTDSSTLTVGFSASKASMICCVACSCGASQIW